MIYTFDKQQNILRVLDKNNFLTAELTFKINEATTFSFTVTPNHELTDEEKYVALPHPLDQTKFIMLRLISRTDNKDDIEYTAYEYAYQELSTSGYIKDTRPKNANALTLMTKALDGSGWSVGRTTVAGTVTTNFYYTDYLSAVSKVVDLLGGEIVFYVEITGNKITGRYMDYLFRQGVDTSKVFADGSNLLSVARKKQSDSIYTAILPRGKGEQVSDGGGNEPDGYGRRIDIKDVVWSTANGKPLNKQAGSFILEDPQATAEYGQTNGNARLLIQNFDEVDDPNVLIQQAYNMLMTMNHPLIEYSATVSDVGTLSLGDTVLIMHGQRNLSYKTRVFQVKYDLLHSENTELSLGDNLSSNNITSQINAIRSSIQTNSNQQAWTVSQFGRPSTTFGATQPTEPKIGDTWFKSLPDGNVEIWHYNGTIWVKVITPKTGEDIAKAVDDAVAQAKEHVEEVKQGLSSDIATAKSQAATLANEAQQNAIDVASKSLGTYLVRLLPGTNIFKTTNSTTIQAQVWKAGQDITSTLDSASFSWKIAKDGANAISLTNNVKNVTAKPSDFNNTGTYIVNVIIPVTDTTGATSNQTFSDSTTIAKVTDGQDGSDGNGISSTTITYATSASGTNAPTSGYTSTIPTVNKGQFLWQRTVTSYTNGTTKNSDVVTYFSKDGVNGLPGMDGGQGMISQPSKPTSGLVDGFLWLDTSQTYPVYYIYDSSIKDFKIYQFNAKNINADQIKAKFVGTDRLSASQIIADDLHVKSANIDGQLIASQITVSSTNGAQTSLANFNLGEMSQSIYDTGQNLAEVKITADSINNFVRDSNGNISSDFQTAFSKTSIITGSTLASSIQTQTASQISSALTDNNGKIISLINQDSSGVQIAGKNIVLDGNTTVTGDFYAKGGNFTNLNASNLNVGTLNGSQVNIINLNADNITSGKLNANMLTGSTAYLNFINTGNICNTVDDQLQISARGMYYEAQNSAQLTLFSSNSDLGDLDRGSIKYLDNSMPYGQQEGLRFKGKSIQAISPDGGSPHLYLMPYNNGELRVTLRGSNYSSYADLRANIITSGNIWLNANHGIYSQDNGKMYFIGGNGDTIDLGVRSLTQSSLVSLKENIRNIETDYALAEVLKSDIRKYNFKTDDKETIHVSPMIDDVDGKLYIPKDWVSSDGDSVDTYNVIGYLIQSIKELNSKIENLSY